MRIKKQVLCHCWNPCYGAYRMVTFQARCKPSRFYLVNVGCFGVALIQYQTQVGFKCASWQLTLSTFIIRTLDSFRSRYWPALMSAAIREIFRGIKMSAKLNFWHNEVKILIAFNFCRNLVQWWLNTISQIGCCIISESVTFIFIKLLPRQGQNVSAT